MTQSLVVLVTQDGWKNVKPAPLTTPQRRVKMTKDQAWTLLKERVSALSKAEKVFAQRVGIESYTKATTQGICPGCGAWRVEGMADGRKVSLCLCNVKRWTV